MTNYVLGLVLIITHIVGVINMKNVFVFAITICLIVVATRCVDFFLIKDKPLKYNNIISESYSADGEYKAVKFTRNVNATTPNSFHLSILRKNDKLKDESGNVYVSYEDFDFEWSNDTTVTIEHKNKNVFKCNSSYLGIKIEYRVTGV